MKKRIILEKPANFETDRYACLKFMVEGYPNWTGYANKAEWDKYELVYKLVTEYDVPESLLDELEHLVYSEGYDNGIESGCDD